ncbi:hypothetical protein EXS56_02405 [Candidatus Kaiserbacteria bacterium]|nr:hypothetical protein [Candidatus Kaiserbacteria bacterium]
MDDRKDIQRDIQKSNPLVRFFDKQTVRTNPFGANQSADRAYRRAERLVAALYLVTNHIPPSEPVRVSIRTGALRILEDVLALRNEMRTESQNVLACRASIRNQISLVRVLAVSGFLSIQNTNAMIEGLDELGVFLNASQNSPLSDTFSLSQESLLDIREGHVKDISSIKDKVSLKDVSKTSDNMSLKKGIHVREEGIVAVLRSGGELGIRDIAANLPEYSEKMIQRHLVDLIAAGRVKKTGLKRWSRYSVIG